MSSEITGGKFRNGTATAAFTWALSQAARPPKSDLQKVLDHLNESGAFRDEYRLAKKYGVNISVIEEGGSYFDHETNTIYWNAAEGSDIAAGISSPASALAHEVTHAAQFHKVGLNAFESSLQAPVLSVDQSAGEVRVRYGVSPEEKRATLFERKVQSQIGEPLRENYRDAAPYEAGSPTFYCHAGTQGCQ